MSINCRKILALLAILSATLIWGVSFSAQRSAMQLLEPLVFTAMRSMFGALTLIPVIMALDKFRHGKISVWGGDLSRREKRDILLGGLLCGTALAGGLLLQQYGLKYTAAGKAGFLTALYVIIVPILGALFFKRKSGILLWLVGGMALFGSYLLCSGGSETVSGSFGFGEICLLCCAVFFSLHVLVIDHFARKTDCIRLSLIQFATATVITTVISLICGEVWSAATMRAAVWFILYCGIMSSGAGFTLQILAQKELHPTTTALLLSMEAVFAVIAGWLILGENLGLRGIAGCTVIFAAVVLSQLKTSR